MAKNDWTQQNDVWEVEDAAVPGGIKVIILDGGGNDVIIANSSCETTAPPANTSCVTTVQTAVNKAQSTIQEMVSDGVESIVYFFYPHLGTDGGGILLTPAPAINETLDYAYPLAEEVCCGTTFTSTLSNYYCTGYPVSGANTKCVFVDTRPAFEGHIADYIKSDNVHPTPAGAQVIADLVWKAMKANCIAQ
jgi:lysophospholipase L1-like esterase